MARPIEVLLIVAAAAAVGGIVVLLRRIRRSITNNQELIMEKFDELKAELDTLKTTIAETATRVETAVNKLMDDALDPSEVDAAKAEVMDAVDALKAIAPDATPTPTPTNPDAPATA